MVLWVKYSQTLTLFPNLDGSLLAPTTAYLLALKKLLSAVLMCAFAMLSDALLCERMQVVSGKEDKV